MILQHTGVCAYLRSGGVALALDWRDGGVPQVVHWGADLGELSAADVIALADASMPGVDAAHSPATAVRARLLLLEADGWKGRPGLTGHRDDGTAWAARLVVQDVAIAEGAARMRDGVVLGEAAALRIHLADDALALRATLDVEMLATGLVRIRGRVRNDGAPYRLEELSFALPVAADADEILDFTGRWTKERIPVRTRVGAGAHLHESRHGRPGFDAEPLLFCGERGFDFATGSVHGVHVGFSGNHRAWVERTPSSVQVIAAGELLLPGETLLPEHGEYRSPWVYFTAGEGLDAAAHRIHDWLRSRPEHPDTRRPVTLNVWEAVYFDHDLPRLLALAERAARIGVERFVLDDGWFAGRRDDTAGLGDWTVDATVWPEGLHPLVERVRELGMEFGLWVEPEMINPDSHLARAHPEWMLVAGAQAPLEWRNQQVLNLAVPEAFEYVRAQLCALLDEYPISYLKWDHNRDLIAAGDATRGGVAVVHDQTEACYRLMDALRAHQPGLEIESCASGGARIDLGMAEHVQRFWPSDCIDPIERHDIMRWTSQLLPLELLGSHVSSPLSRTTGRVSGLDFRAATALFGSFGVEWDLSAASETELDDLASWIDLYRAHRDLLFTGRLHRRDVVDSATRLQGVVSTDGREGLYLFSVLSRSTLSPAGRIRLPGLVAAARYRVRAHAPSRLGGLIRPEWMSADGVVLSGRALARSGLHAPEMFPEQSLLITVEEVSDPPIPLHVDDACTLA